ncbi:MAG: ABC transporter permease subunit [Corynebacterium sp.]|uniref:ABC transporter permease n=1 Tax=Corynebacterium sp. TaxID=1720 RepID=UPI0026DEF0BC|nr:ABC transporter permease subunit [Corynebacterium sp.]MDO5669079.1 ABC transporter permease subunit [Corynebacterium sp.]
MTASVPVLVDKQEPEKKKSTRFNWRTLSSGSVLGALPFFAFVAAFLLIPIIANVVRAFQDPQGNLSFATMAEAAGPIYRPAFLLTAQLSLITSLIGGVFGLILAWALVSAERPRWLKSLVSSFSALASQSGGVQLAFAFVALLGTQGVLTGMIEWLVPGALSNFRITGFLGVTIVYLYFQIPLMAILMLPAMGGLKKAWYDAASSLGATKSQYLRDVAIPVLWPSIIGSLLLLFANAFAAYATAYALSGGSLNLVPIVIGFLISGNVLLNPGLAAALVTWMMIIILAAMGIRFYLTRKSDQWLSN